MAMEATSLGRLDFDALSRLQHSGDVVSPRCREKQEYFSLTPGRECQQSAPVSPRRRQKAPIPSLVHHFSTGDGPTGLLTHFYHIADEEQLASGAQPQRRHCQEEVEPSASLAGFVRAQESQSKSPQRDSSVASSRTTVDDRSACSSSECRCFAGESEDTIWGEVFVTRIQSWYRGRASSLTRKEFLATRIQAWYRGCACRQRRKLFLNGMAGTQVEDKLAKLEMDVFATRIQAWYRGCASRQNRKSSVEDTAGTRDDEEESCETDKKVFVSRIHACHRGCASRQKRKLSLEGTAQTQEEEEESCQPELEVFVIRIQAWYRGCAARQRGKSFVEVMAGTRGEKESFEPEMEIFETRIEPCYRGCGSRLTCKPSCENAAAVHVDEQEAFQPDMTLFTSARLSTSAFKERVRERAYHLFLGGCKDERKNYFDALEAERKLAHVKS
eukprot:TRINITY_DN6164_c0_g1_i1.p1 TRINITY_DN6164_c0_g1~~TRINITY_DN6164_c0_g1_i1.p1  ORF type:complete len:443 (-),score=69.24 TRINITY_DN6164_c0_g1_i1:47-1375(-)